MLCEIYIKNYALIKEASISFDKNLNIITGETGAGKSILLGAIGLLTGKRADLSMLFNPDEKCIIEAQFNLTRKNLSTLFNSYDLDYDAKHAVLRREFTKQGKSRAFINDTPVNLDQLKTIAKHLLEIHSQHENLKLIESEYQLDIIDRYGQITDTKDYAQHFDKFQEIKAQINKIKNQSPTHDLDFLEFQIQEINALNINLQQDQNIETQVLQIENAQTISDKTTEALSLLEHPDKGIIKAFNTIDQHLGALGGAIDQKLTEQSKSIQLEIEDFASELRQLSQQINFDTGTTNKILERFEHIQKILFKHKVKTIADLIDLKDTLRSQINQIKAHEHTLKELYQKENTEYKKAFAIAQSISNKRKIKAKDLSKKITQYIHGLNMKSAEVKFEFTPLNALHHWGIDQSEILVKTNKGHSFKPLEKIASGGEIARITLAIKNICSQYMQSPCLLLDEIDTGVSGVTADLMAQHILAFSKQAQLIVITHLPQIASLPALHYSVKKSSHNEKTQTSISKLSHAQRIQEIAQLLSGKVKNVSAQQTAKELLSLKK